MKPRFCLKSDLAKCCAPYQAIAFGSGIAAIALLLNVGSGPLASRMNSEKNLRLPEILAPLRAHLCKLFTWPRKGALGTCGQIGVGIFRCICRPKDRQAPGPRANGNSILVVAREAIL